MQEKSAKKMSKNRSVPGRRLWNILRLALLWARKGGMFRNRLVLTLNVVGKGIRKLRHSDEQRGALVYGDREFSFDDTPIIHVKMHRPSSMRFKMPHIPCINPHVDFDYDFDFEDDIASKEIDQIGYGDKKFLKGAEEGEEEEEVEVEEEINGGCDEGIDLKAEQFIANFYKQMKLQRQISYVQYHDKLNTGNA